MSKTEARREKLRTELIDAAERHIRAEGLANLRARSLATDAGCAVGAIYNAFADLDEIILHVNSRTLAAFGRDVEKALWKVEGKQPKERLVTLAHSYLKFASSNPNTWAALFDHRMPKGTPRPEWHMHEYSVLFEHIVKPLSELLPDEDEATLLALTHTMFSAVHGLVTLGLQKRLKALPPQNLKEQLTILIGAISLGLPKQLHPD